MYRYMYTYLLSVAVGNSHRIVPERWGSYRDNWLCNHNSCSLGCLLEEEGEGREGGRERGGEGKGEGGEGRGEGGGRERGVGKGERVTFMCYGLHIGLSQPTLTFFMYMYNVYTC